VWGLLAACAVLFLVSCARPAPDQGAEPEAHKAGKRLVLVNMNISTEVTDGYRKIRRVVKHMAPSLRVTIVHYEKLTEKRLRKLDAKAVILGPQSSPWTDYDPIKVEKAAKVVREFDGPVLGICGGHQFLAIAYGGKVGPMQCKPDHRGYEGCLQAAGFTAIDVAAPADPLFKHLPKVVKMEERHYEAVLSLPPGFVALATSHGNLIEAIRLSGRPVYGVQFHPEKYADSKPHGRQLLWNFLELAGLVAPLPDAMLEPDAIAPDRIVTGPSATATKSAPNTEEVR